jgi:DNA-binding MarR family transcriptional regulator
MVEAKTPDHAPLPGADDLDAALIAALEVTVPRYIQTVRRAIEEVEGEFQLTMPQFRCLQAIAARGMALTTQLARQMQVAVPTMTSRLDALVERGLARRQPDPTSRRQVQVTLTPAGYDLLHRYQAIVDARLLALLHPLPVKRRARLLAAVQDLGAALDAAAGPQCGGGSPHPACATLAGATRDS